MNEQALVAKVWNYAHVLRDDGVSYGDYLGQISFLLFLKMDKERADALGEASALPADANWDTLAGRAGEDLERTYRRILDTLSAADIIPVVAPVGIGADGQTYNINADTMAGAIASAMGASRFFLLTDVAGVLDKGGDLMSDLSPADVLRLQKDGTITGGMIPKVQTCVAAVQSGVDAAVILDGRIPHAMLLEIFTRQGAGTLVSARGR